MRSGPCTSCFRMLIIQTLKIYNIQLDFMILGFIIRLAEFVTKLVFCFLILAAINIVAFDFILERNGDVAESITDLGLCAAAALVVYLIIKKYFPFEALLKR